ncbi:glutaminase [Lacinutrix sp. C3R15]|uniref:glutaminase n=1 Tax=Flavobacteriaceae TaxID=49546 RepID=UPI001C094F76|nr:MULTISPECIES: glutaminase [Flavobacteriaceae]MBU2940131.1 glutaminase [Lacinutrix sp. C3R15]MDO6623448.1 glutaminase [Oceanihabitans sp. 1_MG-2023]
MQDFQQVINTIHNQLKDEINRGLVANYIPELSHIDVNKFGIHLRLISGEKFSVGDSHVPFSIQSISKVLSLSLAFQLQGDALWKRMDVEPSGDPFNQLSLLELENGIPRNPFINSGAIVIADILVSQLKKPKEDFLHFVRDLANDQTIDYNPAVAASEKATGFNNYAAAYLLKSFHNLENEVDKVLDFYFYMCSLQMNCEQLTNAFYIYANHGVCLQNKTWLTQSQIKRINAIMLTCGFYDEAGEFAFEVGLPGKSGVGGGIVALLPNNFVISTWSPGLNPRGNSKIGMQALEAFTTKTKLSIF